MDQHKQRRGKRKQAPLQHNFPVFCSQRGNSLTCNSKEMSLNSFYSVFILICWILSLIQCLMFSFFPATLRKCIRPEVSLQVSVILLHSVHECIQFARSFLKTKNKIYNPTSQKKLEKHGKQFLSLINFH